MMKQGNQDCIAVLHAVCSLVAGQNQHKPLLRSVCKLNKSTLMAHILISSNRTQVWLASGEPQPEEVHGDENQLISAAVRTRIAHLTGPRPQDLLEHINQAEHTDHLSFKKTPAQPLFQLRYLMGNCLQQEYEDAAES